MKKLAIVLCLLFIAVLQGCGGKEYTYVEDHELKPGPGLFSGEDGVFTVYEGTFPSSDKKKEAAKQKQKEELE